MVQYIRFRYLLFLLLPVFTANYAVADWINLTGAETAPNIAEIYILDDHVRVQLEIFPADLMVFQDLVPDDWMKKPDVKRLSLNERLRNFSDHILVITDENGNHLRARLETVEARTRVDRRSRFAGMINPITRQRVPEPPADKRVLYAELIYPFNSKPQQLKFVPPLNETGTAKANIGFVVYHQSVPVIDFRYLGQPSTLILDWQDPWYTKFENRNLTRHHKYPIMLYLYVEPRQIRLDALMRASDLAEMTGLPDGVAGNQFDARLDKLRGHVKDYLSHSDLLQVDGEERKPDSTIIRHFKVSLNGLEPVENPSSEEEPSLLIGVSRQYYVSALPRTIESSWPYFNRQFERIPFVSTDPAGPYPDYIYEEDPEFGWKNLLKKYEEPVMRPIDVTTGWRIRLPFFGEKRLFGSPPDQEQANAILINLLENLRIAYIEKEPEALSQALNDVIESDQAGSLKLELARLYAPPMKRGGSGAVKAFGDLEIKAIQHLDEMDGFRATVTGSAVIHAMHWGHTDQQTLQFQMLLDVVETNNQWQLADLTVIDLKDMK